jgi:hypothetical protein
VFCQFKIYAQQNFINVPSSEITSEKKLFFQQQININDILQCNSTIEYGLKHNCEIGFNILGLNFSEHKFSILNDTNKNDPYNPLMLLNFNKSFKINKCLSVCSGLQAGFNFRDDHTTKFVGLLYTNIKFNNIFVSGDNLVLGTYFNTQHYGGKGNRFGPWLGIELPIQKKLHLMVESIFGNNALSYTSCGLVFYSKPNIPLTLAMQIPNTARNQYSLVFELTIIPKTK